MWRVLRTAIALVIALYGLVMLFGVAFDQFVPPDNARVELFKTLFELLLWLAVPLLIVVLLLRTWRVVALMMVVTIAFVLTFLPYFIPRNPATYPSAPHIKMLTFNTEMKPDELADVIRSTDADIVALQEVSLEVADLLPELEDIYPYQAAHPQPDPLRGQAVLSRYPIESEEYWEYKDLLATMGHQRVSIDFEGTSIVIYNTHPWPALAFETGYDDESHRVAMVDVIERSLTEDGPVLVVGDLNMTDEFGEYDMLEEHYTDSFINAGNNIGYTYPNFKFEPFPPMLRLDFIWHNEYFVSEQAVVLSQHGSSDHSPLLATLALVEPES